MCLFQVCFTIEENENVLQMWPVVEVRAVQFLGSILTTVQAFTLHLEIPRRLSAKISNCLVLRD